MLAMSVAYGPWMVLMHHVHDAALGRAGADAQHEVGDAAEA